MPINFFEGEVLYAKQQGEMLVFNCKLTYFTGPLNTMVMVLSEMRLIVIYSTEIMQMLEIMNCQQLHNQNL